MTQPLSLPIGVEDLKEVLPHQDPAIWISKVIEVDSTGGKCQVDFDPQANYCTNGKIRVSSFIEWMGQSYAFVASCQARLEGLDLKKARRALLAAVSKFKTTDALQNLDYAKLTSIIIRVHMVRELGPLALLTANISLEDGTELASAHMKVFAEQ